MAQQLWKSFMEALAPPRRDQQPRRGGVTLNRTVGGRPLPRREADGQAVGRGSGALPGNREVMRANLNVPQPSFPVPERLRSTRAAMMSFRTLTLNQHLGP